MVRISLNEYGYYVSGHADYDEHGYDIVCSAISALTQTIALSLKKHCKAKISMSRTGVVVDIEEPTEESYKLLDTLLIGLTNVQDEYPKHLQIKTKKGVFKE